MKIGCLVTKFYDFIDESVCTFFLHQYILVTAVNSTNFDSDPSTDLNNAVSNSVMYFLDKNARYSRTYCTVFLKNCSTIAIPTHLMQFELIIARLSKILWLQHGLWKCIRDIFLDLEVQQWTKKYCCHEITTTVIVFKRSSKKSWAWNNRVRWISSLEEIDAFYSNIMLKRIM